MKNAIIAIATTLQTAFQYIVIIIIIITIETEKKMVVDC